MLSLSVHTYNKVVLSSVDFSKLYELFLPPQYKTARNKSHRLSVSISRDCHIVTTVSFAKHTLYRFEE